MNENIRQSFKSESAPCIKLRLIYTSASDLCRCLYAVSCASVFICTMHHHPRQCQVHMRTASLQCPRGCFWCNQQYHGQSRRRKRLVGEAVTAANKQFYNFLELQKGDILSISTRTCTTAEQHCLSWTTTDV